MIKTFTADPVRIYMGLDHHCRCGCGGEYAGVGDTKFLPRVKRFYKMLAAATEADVDTTADYVNVSYGNNRAMTIYFTE